MIQALGAAGVGVSFLPRLALHPGVALKPAPEAPSRRILAVALPGRRSPASDAFLALLEGYAAAYPDLQRPARA